MFKWCPQKHKHKGNGNLKNEVLENRISIKRNSEDDSTWKNMKWKIWITSLENSKENIQVENRPLRLNDKSEDLDQISKECKNK